MHFHRQGTQLNVIVTKRLDKPNMNDLCKLNVIVATFYGVKTEAHAEAIRRMVRENVAVFVGDVEGLATADDADAGRGGEVAL